MTKHNFHAFFRHLYLSEQLGCEVEHGIVLERKKKKGEYISARNKNIHKFDIR